MKQIFNLLQKNILEYNTLYKNGKAFYQHLEINKNINCYNLYKSLLTCFPQTYRLYL